MYKINTNWLIKLTILIKIIAFSALFSTSFNASPVEDIKSVDSFLLPVNHLQEKKVNVCLKIPNTFKPVKDYTKKENIFGIIEFISKQDKSVDQWSKKIVLKSFVGAPGRPKAFLDYFVNEFKQNFQKVEVLETVDTKESNYEFGHRIFSYNIVNNIDAIVLVFFASGPLDSAAIHYTILLDSSNTNTDKAKKELKEFLLNQISII